MQSSVEWRTACLALWQRRGPTLISGFLALLIALEVARAAAPLFHQRANAALPAASSPARSPAMPPPTVGVDAQRIVTAHLFGLSPDETVARNPEDAPKSAADLTMVGTLATHDPSKGRAIIGANGEFHVYSVGQRIGEAALKLVYLDHVILDRQGALEKLSLPRAQPLESMPTTAHAPRAAGPARTAAATSRGTPATPLIDTIADADSETDNAGNYLGMRVVPGKDAAAFSHSGLRGGDVILAINGSALDESAHSAAMFKQLATGATVTVLRYGKRQDVTLNLAP